MKHLKHTFLVGILTILGLAANAQFNIHGTITGADGKMIYLFDDEDNYADDSVFIKNNQFNFTIKKPNKERVYALILGENQYPMLLIPGSDPALTFTATEAEFPIAQSLTTNEQTQAMQTYQKLFRPLVNRALNLNIEAARIDSADESGKEAFREKARVFSQDVASTGKAFIKQHPKAIASVWMLLNELRNRLEPDDFMATFYSLDKSVQDSRYGQMAKNYIAQLQGNALNVTAPDFTQDDVKGKPVKLSQFRGKYVLVDFWASWCGPCRQENPNVVKAYEKYKNKNFTILGVSLDQDKNRWIGAIRQDGLNWTQVSDLQGWNNEVARQYGINSIPANFLVSPDGKIIARNLRGAQLEKALESLIK
ncbi:peroxiredoxin [Chitinophaga skermanii]|uniref:Peroxiredoxin n=1 Tax=Chitinophaga skermanii TaxID=331697 RepID=A0A327QH60_9BACT|nr:TlpA disulfide reductase family protein [Chitinophaga skermanii]RAJ02663.1 peroxiredoxin [Chitinophaga skermanii]